MSYNSQLVVIDFTQLQHSRGFDLNFLYQNHHFIKVLVKLLMIRPETKEKNMCQEISRLNPGSFVAAELCGN